MLSWKTVVCGCRAQDQNGLDDEYDDHDLEEAPSHAQERFLGMPFTFTVF